MRYCKTLLSVLTIALLTATDVRSAEQPLRVLGSAHLEAQVTRPARDVLRLDGRLADDAGGPVPGANVELTFPGSPGATARPCRPARGPRKSPPVALETDASGRFCALLGEELEGVQLHLAYRDPADLLGESHLELKAQAAPRGLELLLNVSPDLPLDLPRHTVEVAVLPRARELAETPEAAPTPEDALAVQLVLEAPHRSSLALGVLHVRPGERGRAELPSVDLGEPGSAMLVARFEGNPSWAPAESRRQVSKTAPVFLEAPRTLRVQSSGGPAELLVRARWQRGPTAAGSVEALLADRRVGASAISQGQARLSIELPEELREGLANPRELPSALQLVYVPNAPWWRAGPPAQVALEIEPPSPWSWVPWLLAAAGILGWVAVIWRRPAGRAQATPRLSEPPGRASLSLIAPGDEVGGLVFDAHSGEPVAKALVEVVVPGVQQARVVGSSRAGADGSFTLLIEEPWEGLGACIRFAAPGYSSLERPLTKKGRLLVHLVTARRAILDRFVHWARRRGAPWAAPLPPTPAQIAAVAEARREEPTARWARDVEAAVFGPDLPTEDTEQELRDREPAQTRAP